MARAVELGVESVKAGGGPFGAVLVRDGEIISTGQNRVTQNNDPTAHAEIVCIRAACEKLGSFHLEGCELYTSCEPCPMCLAALYWAHVDRIWFAAGREDAKAAGFDDDHIYREMTLSLDARSIPIERVALAEYASPFEAWERHGERREY